MVSSLLLLAWKPYSGGGGGRGVGQMAGGGLGAEIETLIGLLPVRAAKRRLEFDRADGEVKCHPRLVGARPPSCPRGWLQTASWSA